MLVVPSVVNVVILLKVSEAKYNVPKLARLVRAAVEAIDPSYKYNPPSLVMLRVDPLSMVPPEYILRV